MGVQGWCILKGIPLASWRNFTGETVKCRADEEPPRWIEHRQGGQFIGRHEHDSGVYATLEIKGTHQVPTIFPVERLRVRAAP